jgi:hypothetical protein
VVAYLAERPALIAAMPWASADGASLEEASPAGSAR